MGSSDEDEDVSEDSGVEADDEGGPDDDEESEWETYADVIVGGVVGEIGALAVGAVKVRFLSMLSVI